MDLKFRDNVAAFELKGFFFKTKGKYTQFQKLASIQTQVKQQRGWKKVEEKATQSPGD